MHVLITAGPTREPIDDVRFLSNISSGRLGVAVATAFSRAGHWVTLLRGEGALAPPSDPRIQDVEFGSAVSLLAAILQRTDPAASPGFGVPDVMIHAAAVADYAPVPLEGKIASTQPSLVLELTPTPKVADRVRLDRPNLPIILFKLEAKISEDELFARARRTMTRVGAAAIVANLLGDVGVTDHRAVLLRPDGTKVDAPTRSDIARVLVEEARAIVESFRESK